MTPQWISNLLGSRSLHLPARILLTCTFWMSGITKLFHFTDAVAEVAALGLPMPVLVAALTVFIQLAGAALVIHGGQFVWLGAGALGVFTGMAIILVHPFWVFDGPNAALNIAIATEHLSVIGGLVLASILARRTGYAR